MGVGCQVSNEIPQTHLFLEDTVSSTNNKELSWLPGGSDGKKNLPVMQETWVWSLGQEDPFKKGVATHSSILAWRIPQTEEPGGLWSMELQRVQQDCTTNT